MRRGALFLTNQRAGRAAAGLTDAITCLEQAGFDLVRPPRGSRPSSAPDIRHLLEAVDLVIVAGGDGTINSVIAELIDCPKPLGILPLGTANDLARTLDIPFDLAAACSVIAAGHTRRIDVSTVNGRYFCNVASMGLSVQITRLLTGKTKQRFGVFAYALAAVRGLRDLQHFHATIHGPAGILRSRTVQIAVGNGKYYGGGMVVAADAAIDDHLLHLYSLEVEHWWEVLALFPALRRGSHIYWRNTRTLVAPELTIETRRPRSIDADGELAARTPARFRILPAAIAVLSPPPGPDGPRAT
jgi:diacylglycerol kinase (ATP)